MKLRDYTPDDYSDLADIQNANFPDMPAVVEDYVETDTHLLKDERSVFTRQVVEIDNRVVGYFQYLRDVWNFDPYKFRVTVRLHPDYQKQGIGTYLVEQLTKCLEPYNPTVIYATVREYHPHGLAFAEKYEFSEAERSSESWLTLADFDPSVYGDVETRLLKEGVEIKSYNDLAPIYSDLDKRLYDLFQAIEPDIPGDEPHQEPGFEAWYNDYLMHPRLAKDAFKIAVHGDELVGLSNLWTDLASDMLYTDLTGVRREYRGKGIAVALKLAVIKWALTNGNSVIKTQNGVSNAGMLSINYRLGYQKQAEWIYMKRILRTEE